MLKMPERCISATARAKPRKASPPPRRYSKRSSQIPRLVFAGPRAPVGFDEDERDLLDDSVLSIDIAFSLAATALSRSRAAVRLMFPRAATTVPAAISNVPKAIITPHPVLEIVIAPPGIASACTSRRSYVERAPSTQAVPKIAPLTFSHAPKSAAPVGSSMKWPQYPFLHESTGPLRNRVRKAAGGPLCTRDIAEDFFSSPTSLCNSKQTLVQNFSVKTFAPFLGCYSCHRCNVSAR
jgi:hypothetical protein